MKVGDKIKQMRKNNEIAQKDFADMLNIPVSTLANYENNHRTPKIDVLTKIADTLGTSLNELMEDKTHVAFGDMSDFDLKGLLAYLKKVRKQNRIGIKKMARLMDIDFDMLQRIEDEEIPIADIILRYKSLLDEVVEIRNSLIANIIDYGIFYDSNDFDLANLFKMDRNEYENFIFSVNSYIEFISINMSEETDGK